MQGVNYIMLVGNVGEQPTLYYVHGDIPMAKFSVATNDAASSQRNKPPKTQWHHIVAWRRLAQYAVTQLSKGSYVIVHGSLKYNEWIDRDGLKKKDTYILAKELEVLNT